MFDDLFRDDPEQVDYILFHHTHPDSSTVLTAGQFLNFVNQIYQAPINYAEDFAAWEEECR